MNNRKMQLIGIALVIGSILGLISIPRSIPVTINGETQYLNTNALTVSAALERDGFSFEENDEITPSDSSLLLGVEEIKVELARPVNIKIYPENQEISLITAERIPEKLLAEADIEIGEKDQVLIEGKPANMVEPLPYLGDYQLVVRHAVQISVDDVGQSSMISSSAENLGQALEENDIRLNQGDRISPELDTTLSSDIDVIIQRARPVEIQIQDQKIDIQTAADTVAEAMAEAGLGLQGSDYSIPDSDQPIPEDGQIRLVRVREEVLLTQSTIAYTNEYIQSDQVELDNSEVVQPGEFGVEVTRTRVIYEDDQEVSRIEEITWVAKEPKTQLTGRGTRVQVRTLDTPQGPIEYWRAVNVYATSYSPCRSGVDRCYYGTASGLPAAYGAIGVTRAWYNLMVGQRLYVPGYGIGTVADIGGGVPGQYWIDLAYSDDDYVAWHHNITIYFLTPVPDNIPWILP
ncbi:MAG: ubiquitin-like domain-containing protein [Anaerolineaceae bacterium]|nr:ubiquitin-like domain-containing protein [Anaerolineaceae bacterium]